MTVSRRLLLTLPALSWLPASAQTAAATLDPRLRKRAERAVAADCITCAASRRPTDR
jgi:hypothetical protein